MGGGVLTDALTFLIRTLFDLYIVAVALRFLLQWVRADFYNPLSQFLVKITNPPLRPLRRFIPGYGGIDFAWGWSSPAASRPPWGCWSSVWRRS